MFISSRAEEEWKDELVHNSLTLEARERLARLIAHNFKTEEKKQALHNAKKWEPGDPFQQIHNLELSDSFYSFMREKKEELVLTYLEHLFYAAKEKREIEGKKSLRNTLAEVKLILESEGILIDLYEDDDSHTKFRKLSSEEFKQIDEQLRGLGGKGWEEELELYRKAMARYADGEYHSDMLEK